MGAPEIILIIIAILVLFGGKKIPEMMKGLGRSIKDFKAAQEPEPIPVEVKETRFK
ncbi:twin-arginine translocase TatA/TatE family subunit [Mucilaginibacter sp.]|uniref:twin-arginine translocase TatA/TatE family subunit n=1 Tax=Mucilaginibacter sp. TaxID=1882438 RepID=UPI00262C3F77|nr:twin-arginine translocase TatA/TatE family subunit [Mucilaginibacter sp.]MDB5127820.1 preprotein translocase [Mucilaginibacter sp.]